MQLRYELNADEEDLRATVTLLRAQRGGRKMKEEEEEQARWMNVYTGKIGLHPSSNNILKVDGS